MISQDCDFQLKMQKKPFVGRTWSDPLGELTGLGWDEPPRRGGDGEGRQSREGGENVKEREEDRTGERAKPAI